MNAYIDCFLVKTPDDLLSPFVSFLSMQSVLFPFMVSILVVGKASWRLSGLKSVSVVVALPLLL
jgi:hypothetical protein